MHGSQCLSYPQHFAALVYCRYLYPTHLQLTTPLLTYEALYFLSSCSPPPTNPMSVLLLLVFVLTCVLLIPFPNPGLGYRAAEKPDPLLSSSPSRYLSVSLPDYRVVLYLNGKVKWTLGLCFDCQAKSVFWHIQIVSVFFLFSFRKSHEMRFLQIRFKPHLEADLHRYISVCTLKSDFRVSFMSLAMCKTTVMSNPEGMASEQLSRCY